MSVYYTVLAFLVLVACFVSAYVHRPEEALWTIPFSILCVANELKKMNDKEGDDE